MPSCRNCGARLSKFDKDICPVCGTKNPLQGVSSETIEITSQVDMSDFKEGQKIVKRRKTMLLIALLLGWTGAMFFYLKKAKAGFIWLLINIILLAASFSLFYFALSMNIALSIVFPIVLIYVYNAICAVLFYCTKDLKDGEGEFVV